MLTPEEHQAKLKRTYQLTKLIRKHEAELAAITKYIKDNCHCPLDARSKESTYYSGSYYDRATTTHWEQCSVCGCQFNKRTETHSWYG